MHAKEQPFGVLLKRYRLAAGLSQANLAERAHLSARGISDLERGARRAPRQATVQRLIDALQLDPADQQTLLTGIHRYRLPRPVDAPLPGYIDDLQADETNVVVPSPEEDYCPLGGIVPAQPTVLFGRQQELESIRRRLTVEHVRLLTLTGPA